MSSLQGGIITSGFGDRSLLITQGYGSSFISFTLSFFETLASPSDLSNKWNAFRTYVDEVHATETFATRWDAQRIYQEGISLLSIPLKEWKISRIFSDSLSFSKTVRSKIFNILHENLNFLGLLESEFGKKLAEYSSTHDASFLEFRKILSDFLLGSVTGIFSQVIEKIEELSRGVKRLIPRKRNQVQFKIPILGNVMSQTRKQLDIFGFPFQRISSSIHINGNLVIRLSRTLAVLGLPTIFLSSSLKVLGNVSQKLGTIIQVKGIKDLKKILWEILEEENEE